MNNSENEIYEPVQGQYFSKTFVKEDIEYDMVQSENFVEWFIENYKKYVARLEVVSERRKLCVQFSKGFSGIGGILRYKIDEPGFIDDCPDIYDDGLILINK